MSETHAGGRMPALFIGHGSPMNALEDNEFSRGWREVAEQMPRPRAVLCISAHWETNGVQVTSSAHPETIHDFYGFPEALFKVVYPAPGDRQLACRVADLLGGAGADLDPRRGLDHGAWSVLRAMYPGADVPVVQLSLATEKSGAFHLQLARNLAPLRNESVLILGSGNIVHNLRLLDWQRDDGFDWADRFRDAVRGRIEARGYAALAAYETLGPESRLAVPTPEHYLPLLYALGVQEQNEHLSFFCDRTVMGSISMMSVKVGQ
jgi:4,5-DOPA dioxygenase extradiol